MNYRALTSPEDISHGGCEMGLIWSALRVRSKCPPRCLCGPQTSKIVNWCHCSEHESSNLEAKMQMFMPQPQIFVERTLALIKPDVIDKEEEIEDHILRSGFLIVQVTGCAPEKITAVYKSEQYLP